MAQERLKAQTPARERRLHLELAGQVPIKERDRLAVLKASRLQARRSQI
jgi:hypothetical protein